MPLPQIVRLVAETDVFIAANGADQTFVYLLPAGAVAVDIGGFYYPTWTSGRGFNKRANLRYCYNWWATLAGVDMLVVNATVNSRNSSQRSARPATSPAGWYLSLPEWRQLIDEAVSRLREGNLHRAGVPEGLEDVVSPGALHPLHQSSNRPRVG